MKHCLVVDDSTIVRMIALRVLSSAGLRVTEAENGAAALARCLEDMPDAILLDLEMPELDGVEFLKALRTSPEGGRPQVVVCSSGGQDKLDAARAAGADTFLDKPFTLSSLEAKAVEIGLVASKGPVAR